MNNINIKARLSNVLKAEASKGNTIKTKATTSKLDCDNLTQLVYKSTIAEVLAATDAAAKTVPLISAADKEKSISGVNAIHDRDKYLDVLSGVISPDYVDAKNTETNLSNGVAIAAYFEDEHNSYIVERIETDGTYNIASPIFKYGDQGYALATVTLPFEFKKKGRMEIIYNKTDGSAVSNLRLYLRKKVSTVVVSAGNYDVDATPILSVMTGLTNSDKTNISNLVSDLKACSCWAGLDVLYIFAINNATNANINWKDPSKFSASPKNTPTFTSYQGYGFNGTIQYIDTNFSPSVEIPNNCKYRPLDASMGAYIRNRNTTAPYHCIAGSGDNNANSTNRISINSAHNSLGPSIAINDKTGYSASSGTSSIVNGLFHGYRRTVSGIDKVVLVNKNIVKSIANTIDVPGIPQYSIYIGNLRQGPSNYITPFNGQLALFFLGNSDMHNNLSGFNTAIENYMIAVGANV